MFVTIQNILNIISMLLFKFYYNLNNRILFDSERHSSIDIIIYVFHLDTR